MSRQSGKHFREEEASPNTATDDGTPPKRSSKRLKTMHVSQDKIPEDSLSAVTPRQTLQEALADSKKQKAGSLLGSKEHKETYARRLNAFSAVREKPNSFASGSGSNSSAPPAPYSTKSLEQLAHRVRENGSSKADVSSGAGSPKVDREKVYHITVLGRETKVTQRGLERNEKGEGKPAWPHPLPALVLASGAPSSQDPYDYSSSGSQTPRIASPVTPVTRTDSFPFASGQSTLNLDGEKLVRGPLTRKGSKDSPVPFFRASSGKAEVGKSDASIPGLGFDKSR